MENLTFIRSTDGLSWPTGDSRAVALVDVTPDDLERLLDVPLESGTEEGLGPWRGIGIRLPSGRYIGLLWHEFKPAPRGFVIEADARDDLAAARRECLATLGLSEAQVIWVPVE